MRYQDGYATTRKETMEQITDTIKSVLDETQELTTKEKKTSTTSAGLEEQWKIDKWIEFFKFDTFRDPVLEKMRWSAIRFAEALWNDKRPRTLVLVGDSGTGKTHLAKKLFKLAWRRIMLHRQFTRDIPGTKPDNRLTLHHWCYWPDISDGFKRGEYEIVDELISNWFIVLDDIGGDHDPSRVGIDKLCQILSKREGKWTVVTANLSLAEIGKQMDSRIASRLLRNNADVVEVKTEDYEIRRRKNKKTV